MHVYVQLIELRCVQRLNVQYVQKVRKHMHKHYMRYQHWLWLQSLWQQTTGVLDLYTCRFAAALVSDRFSADSWCFSAGETHGNMKLVKTGDGNIEEVVEVETRTDQMVVPAVSAAATVIVITAGFVAMWRFKRKKQQHMEADNQQLVWNVQEFLVQ